MPLTAGIDVRDLCVQFKSGARVLDELSLTIASGEIIGLLGGSGSGKSTLLRTIARLQPATSGAVEFTGLTPKRRATDLAYVFQDPTLLPWRTARQNVGLPLELAGRKSQGASLDVAGSSGAPEGTASSALRGSVAERVDDALAAVGLAKPSWDRYPRELSGGMRMRVSLARAIVTDPAIMLLDEPFAALDEILRARMNELIVELWQRRPRTIIFVTHNIAEALNLSQRIAILGSGRVQHWIDNPLPFPRSAEVRSSTPFADLYARVSAALMETVGA